MESALFSFFTLSSTKSESLLSWPNYVWKKMLVSTRQIKEKLLLHITLLRLSPLTIQFKHGYKQFAFIPFSTKLPSRKNSQVHRGGENLALLLFCIQALWFFIISISTCINSVRKMLGNQIVFTPSIKGIPFSEYLSLHLGIVLPHVNWANLVSTNSPKMQPVVT